MLSIRGIDEACDSHFFLDITLNLPRQDRRYKEKIHKGNTEQHFTNFLASPPCHNSFLAVEFAPY